MFVEPKSIYSSYSKNGIGRTIYTVTMSIKPLVAIEIGSLGGYSAICIAQALRDLGGQRHLYCYDLFEDYKYRKSTINQTRENIKKYGLEEYITLHQKDMKHAIKIAQGRCDFLHVDVSNDGDIIKMVSNVIHKPSQTVIFEGGTKERDHVEWMIKYKKTPIIGSCKYNVIDERFPGLSML